MTATPPGFLANFDSASAMLRATSNFAQGRDFPAIGQSPALKPLARAVSHAPQRVREEIFALGGLGEAISPHRLGFLDTEKLSRWAAGRYPARRYPVVAVGSSNGAGVHLWSALGAAWLPQTFLIPVRQLGIDPDEPKDALNEGMKFAPALLEANPDIQLHHMHDANQDRLMVSYMDYYRIKRRRLGPSYEAFLRERLEPGGTIVVVNCQRRWPVTRLGERHIFQHGALGGATETEFLEGSERVARYLERYDSHRRRWDSPEANEDAPEAEWGFEPSLQEDVERFAAQHGFRVKVLSFYEPEDLSPFVADLYRWWYRRRGLKANRLLIESFILLEPYWALRTGAVPFWMKFNMEPSAEAVERYLDNTDTPFDDIGLMLFNHGVEAVGLPSVARWQAILSQARRRGRFIGVDEDLFPLDFGSLANYHDEVKQWPSRYPLPGYLDLQEVEEFLGQAADDRYGVELSEA